MNSLLSEEQCVEILTKSLKTSDFTFEKFKLEKFGGEVAGYLGEHLSLSVWYRPLKGELQVAQYFVKCLPQNNAEQRDFVKSMGVMGAEAILYQKLISKLGPLVSSPFSAEFYYGREDVMVFENLQIRGFRMPTSLYLNEDKVRLALKTMARMHSASLKYEHSQSNLLDECQKELTLHKQDYLEGHPSNNWFKAGVKCVAQLSELFTGSLKYKEKILDLAQAMPDFDDVSSLTPNVLCHGDLWGNNLMFSNDDCLFVDFQLARYGPPAFDFWVFLCFNTELSKLKVQELADVYLEALEDVALPKDQFIKSLDYYAQAALFHVCVNATFIFVPEEFLSLVMRNRILYDDFSFNDRSKYILEQIKTNKIQEARLRNLVVPLCEMFDQ